MAHDDFMSWPEDLQALIDDIGTVEGLDVMCAMARDPFTPRRLEQLSDDLALDRFALDDAIRRLVGKGLLERLVDGRVLVASGPPARANALAAVSHLCERDRANVLGAIAHFSISRIRTSAVRTFVRKQPAERDDG